MNEGELIREAVMRHGNAQEVMNATGAGQDCGCCRDEVREICTQISCNGCPQSEAAAGGCLLSEGAIV
jgi:bacterioferritin-associated ferredoxin